VQFTRRMTVETNLTDREREILAGVAEGGTPEQISAALGISPRTAAVHIQRAAYKLGAADGTEAVAIAIRAGLIPHKKNGARA
jgi:DNA-binding CsgD family transcriptional regulator